MGFCEAFKGIFGLEIALLAPDILGRFSGCRLDFVWRLDGRTGIMALFVSEM
jgi:hypothetical protein